MLTNYVMAELLLVRPEDQRFLDKAGGGLRYLVFDELHTYRGRQGADVAMLIRRLKQRCAAPNLIHVGTSATMVSSAGASPASRRAAVAEFAQRLFGHPFGAESVIEETLENVHRRRCAYAGRAVCCRSSRVAARRGGACAATGLRVGRG